MSDVVSTAIDAAFVKHFQAEVVTAYQQMGSKLRSTVRSKNNIVGASTTFQVIGKASATTKARNGVVTAMELSHTPVECSLSDYYAGAWIDKLDELKVGHDERRAVAQMGAYALGRKTDDLIITELNKSTNVIGSASEAVNLDKATILQAFSTLNTADVPDDGERYALVAPEQWNQLLNIEEFSSANYVGEKTPFIAGCESRKWLGINWIMHTGLPKETGTHNCFIYHKNAIGHAVGMDIKTDITWHGDHAAHFVNSMMSQGACLIDDSAVVKLICTDTASSS